MTEVHIKAVGRLIRARRMEQGLSVQALADQVGTSAETVVSWEQGIHPPHKEYLKKLEAIFDGELVANNAKPRPRRQVRRPGFAIRLMRHGRNFGRRFVRH